MLLSLQNKIIVERVKKKGKKKKNTSVHERFWIKDEYSFGEEKKKSNV